MRQIIFVNRYFYPDHSATSQILSDLAFHIASRGSRVSVIASRQSYENPDAQLPARETVRGVDIHRVKTTTFGRASLPGRALDYLSFYVSVWRAIGATAKPGDILIAKTDPPLLSIIGALARRRRELVLINWLQDLYPEVAGELGVPFLKGPVLSALAAIRNWSLRMATANVAIGGKMAERIIAAGVEPARVHIIANWTDDEAITPVAHSDNPLIQEWGLEGKFVVGYSGNLGRAHEYETILGAAERLRDDPHIVFLFVGGGASFEKLQAEVKSRGLQAAFRFEPYQPDRLLRLSLGVPHVHWLSLRPQLEGLHPIAGLPVVADLSAEHAVAGVDPRQIAVSEALPAVAQIPTGIEAGPRIEDRGHDGGRLVGRRFPDREIGGLRG